MRNYWGGPGCGAFCRGPWGRCTGRGCIHRDGHRGNRGGIWIGW